MGLFSQKKGTGDKKFFLLGEQLARLMVSKLGDVMILISRITTQSVKINHQSEVMVEGIRRGNAAVDEVNTAMKSIVGQIDRQATLVNTSAGALEEISASIVNVEQIVQNRQRSILDLGSKIDRGGNSLRESEASIQEVFRSLESVKRLIGLIEGIAGKTNLLALNASIEAARSGEAGKGFAVVASEIRDLAKEAGLKTQDIVGTIGDLVNRITRAQEASGAAGEVFQEIEKTVSEVQAGFQEITRSTSDLSSGAKEILRSTQELRTLSLEIKDESTEVMAATGAVTEIMARAQETVNVTQEGLRGVSYAAEELGVLAEEMIKLSGRNNQNWESQTRTDPEAQKRLTLSTLLSHHYQWLAKGRKIIRGLESTDPQNLGSHTTCALGKWLEAGGRDHLRQSGSAERLDSFHREFHETIGELAQMVIAGEMGKAEDRYQKLTGLAEKISSILVGNQVRPIPQWTPEISVGVQTFDQHHQKLLELVKRLKDEMIKASDRQVIIPVFEELLSYTVYHFSAEEAAFAEYGYELEPQHKEAHRSLVAQAVALKEDWEKGRISAMMESLEFLTDWVMNHILGTDRKYSAFFKNKPVDAFLAKRPQV